MDRRILVNKEDRRPADTPERDSVTFVPQHLRLIQGF